MPTYTIVATCAGESAQAVVAIPDLTGTLDVTAEALTATATITGLSDDTSVTVDWGDGTEPETVTLTDGSATATHAYTDDTGSPYTVTVTGDTSGAILTDTVAVTPPQLPTPENLRVDDVSADPPTSSSFTVTWDAVPGATGYTATATGGSQTDWPGTVAGTIASFSSLEADTPYEVSVVALGDGTSGTDSTAATLTVSTTAAA